MVESRSWAWSLSTAGWHHQTFGIFLGHCVAFHAFPVAAGQILRLRLGSNSVQHFTRLSQLIHFLVHCAAGTNSPLGSSSKTRVLDKYIWVVSVVLPMLCETLATQHILPWHLDSRLSWCKESRTRTHLWWFLSFPSLSTYPILSK